MHTLFTMAGMVVMMVPLIIGAVILQAAVPDPVTDAEMLLGNIPSLLVPIGAIGLVWVFMKYIDRRPLREAGLFVDRRTLPTFVLGRGRVDGAAAGSRLGHAGWSRASAHSRSAPCTHCHRGSPASTA